MVEKLYWIFEVNWLYFWNAINYNVNDITAFEYAVVDDNELKSWIELKAIIAIFVSAINCWILLSLFEI